MRRRPNVLRLLRVAAGVPMYEVAERVGLDLPRLSRYERGVLQPTEAEVRAIVGILGPSAIAALLEAAALLDGAGAEVAE